MYFLISGLKGLKEWCTDSMSIFSPRFGFFKNLVLLKAIWQRHAQTETKVQKVEPERVLLGITGAKSVDKSQRSSSGRANQYAAECELICALAVAKDNYSILYAATFCHWPAKAPYLCSLQCFACSLDVLVLFSLLQRPAMDSVYRTLKTHQHVVQEQVGVIDVTTCYLHAGRRGNWLFCRAVTSIWSQRLPHKMANSQCSFHGSCSRLLNVEM